MAFGANFNLEITLSGLSLDNFAASASNDVTSSDVTIGFDTAMNTVIEMVDRLRDTCESHARCDVVEVMGRWAGHIALRTGIATGASAIAIAEIPFDEEKAIQDIIRQKEAGKRGFIVIVSEGLPGYAEKLAKTVEARTGIETKFARLAHVQRGGTPTLEDRLLASEMGVAAVERLFEGESNVVIGKREGEIVVTNIKKALTVDRMFKKKITEEEIAALSPEDKAWMEARCAKVQAGMERLYHIANEVK